jgi:methyl-accepting chemotaxis protein
MKKYVHLFHAMGLGEKLVSIIIATTLLMVSVLVGISSHTVTDILEHSATKEMSLNNDVVFGMLNVIEKSAKIQSEQSIKVVTSTFPGQFNTDLTTTEVSGKKLPSLFHRDEMVTGDTTSLQYAGLRTGEIAAVLAKADQDFIWVASTLTDESGQDTLGFSLDKDHPAYKALIAGDIYFGGQSIYNKMYMARYQPIKDTKNQVIGAFLVAIDLSDQLSAFKQEIKNLTVGKEGYVYILEALGKDKGTLVSHPTLIGKNLLNTKDKNNNSFIQKMLSTQQGEIRYTWNNTSDNTLQEKIALYRTHQSFGWVIVASGSITDIFGRVSKERWLIIIPAIILNGIFCIIFFSIIRRFVVLPLKEAACLAEKLAHGDLTIQTHETRHDEVGRLLNSINGIGQGLSKIVHQVREVAHSITLSSGSITSDNHNLSLRTQENATHLEQTATSLEQLTTMVKQNAENATIAAKLAHQAASIAAQGGAAVSHVVETMQDIHGSSKKINEITSVIDGIAFQTNILALNAAVEAARAGEQGRGFAVVAAEVRGLAQRSASAAKEIKGLIELSTQKIQTGYLTVEQAGKTIDEVVKQSQTVESLITEISTATDEQSQGLDVINQAIAQIDTGTQHNAQLAEQGALAAESLKNQASHLEEVVSIFMLR